MSGRSTESRVVFSTRPYGHHHTVKGIFVADIHQVTLALCLTGGMPPLRGLCVFPAQLVAGIAAAGVVSALFPGPLNCSTRLGGGASIAQGLFIEMFLTAQLVFVIIMLAVVKHKSTYLAPIGIGLAFFVAELIGKYLSYRNPSRIVLTLHTR
jgi:Glycerol uptake facilitator and related permeases (Major Intrinsic Protein Family)